MQSALSFEYSRRVTRKRPVALAVDETFFAGICARDVTETYHLGYLHQRDLRWHETLQYFIASIAISSKLSIHVSISAIAIIERYQATRAARGENVAASVEEACRLFLSAYMMAASQLYNKHPMSFWRELTGGVYTMQELHAMRDQVCDTAERDDALTEDLYQETVSWIIIEYRQKRDSWARDEQLKALEHMSRVEMRRFARRKGRGIMAPLDLSLYHNPRPRS